MRQNLPIASSILAHGKWFRAPAGQKLTRSHPRFQRDQRESIPKARPKTLPREQAGFEEQMVTQCWHLCEV
jgi:hypothetical protein